jgi:hypothetical protein
MSSRLTVLSAKVARGCLLDRCLGGDGHQRNAVLGYLLLGNGCLQDGACLRESYRVVVGVISSNTSPCCTSWLSVTYTCKTCPAS